MGMGMAGNLLKAGLPLTVYNRTRARAEALSEQGAHVAESPRAAAQDADIVISMVADDSASRQVWTGPDGVFDVAKADSVLVECGTLSLSWVKELAEMARVRGLAFIDSPVLGSKKAAATATLKLLVGGEAEAVEKARPALEAIGSEIMHLGPAGSGAIMKLINNMMAAVHVVTASEGIVLAERAGLNIDQVRAVIENGATGSPMVKGKLNRMLDRQYEDADFALEWMNKDIDYAIQLAKQFDLPLRMVEAAHEAFQEALKQGLRREDTSVVIETVRHA
jgi:3-hydroxyisobutyrate dehydrogenase